MSLDAGALDALFREARTQNAGSTSRSPTTTCCAIFDL